jgi:hypothetical protein
MFDFFKKKKQETPALHYDPTFIKVTDIRKGFLLDYDFKTWQVEDEYEYDWGNNRFSYEFKITSTNESLYLRIEQQQQTLCYLLQKLRFSKLGEYVENHLRQNEKPPREITFEGVKYTREKETPGFFRNTADAEDEGAEMLSWEYIDDSETRVLIIDQWDVEEFEALIGKIVPETAISNILPNA